jgi:hypothetical protein
MLPVTSQDATDPGKAMNTTHDIDRHNGEGARALRGFLRAVRHEDGSVCSGRTSVRLEPIVVTLSARAVFDGLNPLTQYAIQVCAVGSSGPGNWSDAATVAVL